MTKCISLSCSLILPFASKKPLNNLLVRSGLHSSYLASVSQAANYRQIILWRWPVKKPNQLVCNFWFLLTPHNFYNLKGIALLHKHSFCCCHLFFCREKWQDHRRDSFDNMLLIFCIWSAVFYIIYSIIYYWSGFFISVF